MEDHFAGMLLAAAAAARRDGSEGIHPHHLLVGALAKDRTASSRLFQLHVADAFRREVDGLDLAASAHGHLPVSGAALEILAAGFRGSGFSVRSAPALLTKALLLGLLSMEPGRLALQAAGLDEDAVRRVASE